MQIGHECDLGCDQERPLHAPHGQHTSTYHHRSSGYQWQESFSCQFMKQSPVMQHGNVNIYTK